MWTASCAASSSSRGVARACLGLLALWLAWPCCRGPSPLARDYPPNYPPDFPLEIIELRSRLPEELIPILSPLAGPDGTVVGAQHALFVRAAPERLADIRRALAELDRPARSLLIQVRQGESLNGSGARAGVRINEPLGVREGQSRLRVGPPGPEGTQVIASAGRGRSERDLMQEVRALDGHPAYIAVGREQPMPYRDLEVGPRGAWLRQGQDYWRSESGFIVIPRVLGDRVTLEIQTRSASPGRGGAVDTGTLSSRVEGRLGDWIPVGASHETDQAETGGLLYGAQGRRETQAQVELRVLPLD